MVTVKRLPKDPGPAAWNALLPLRAPARCLEERTTADWLVIGAGWAGLAAARRLQQLRAGDRIVLLEASRVGEGPAGRNSGFMIDLPHDLAGDNYNGAAEADRRQIRMNRAAIAFAAEAAGELGMPAEAFAQVGKVNAAATEKGARHLDDYARHLDQLGEACEPLDDEAMRQLTGTSFYRQGLHTPGAAMVQPALFVRAVADGAVASGLALYERSPVTALEKGRPGLAGGHAVGFRHRGTRRAGGQRPCRELRVLRTPADARLHLCLHDPSAHDRGGRTPGRLAPLGRPARRSHGVDGPPHLGHGRRPHRHPQPVHLRPFARNRRPPDRTRRESHDRSFAARFPMLEGVAMHYRWGGRLCLSRNGVPAFGEVERNLFAACCQNGLGTTKGTLAGMLAAELAAGHDNSMIAEWQAFDHPERLPPEPLAWLGANAVMRWKERRAGLEL